MEIYTEQNSYEYNWIHDTKMIFSEPSHGVYVTTNCEVASTNYLVHPPIRNDVKVYIDVEEDEYFTTCY